ncbi:MAG TPA: hypothetical protein VIO33_00720 [Burkholderiaceae bacterium]
MSDGFHFNAPASLATLSLGATARRSRPAGEFLSFAGPNERNQSKGPNTIRAQRFGKKTRLMTSGSTRRKGALSSQVFWDGRAADGVARLAINRFLLATPSC